MSPAQICEQRLATVRSANISWFCFDSLEQARQRHALHELDRQEHPALVVAPGGDGDDVDVMERRRQPGLVEEHGDELRVGGDVGVEALDRDHLPGEPALFDARELHRAHPATGDLGEPCELHRLGGRKRHAGHRGAS